jgi:hypothetical protein
MARCSGSRRPGLTRAVTRYRMCYELPGSSAASRARPHSSMMSR